ncbi:MAG: NMD protein affecting ribosome stability and mRNA decay [Methanospirillum sp.]|nr:NMD protein affecting ribosome stability and mRNA decay [Methanospirillum sp.]
MDIRETFCPRCGGPAGDGSDGLCGRCRLAETRWLECETRAVHTYCPSCGAWRSGRVWTDSDRGRDEVGPGLALSALRLHPEVRLPRFEVSIRELSTNRSTANIKVWGTLYGEQVSGDCRVELVWQKEQCDRCNRIAGSYFEGYVQIRASGRALTSRELQSAARIAHETECASQAEGDRLSYVSDLRETREGLDIVIGSQAIGLSIAQAVAQQLGGRVSTHPKLVGEKAGRSLYRVTYLVRLHQFVRDDVIAVGSADLMIASSEGDHVRAVDLSTGKSRTVRDEVPKRLIGHGSDAVEALVAYLDGGVMGMIDPESSRSIEVPHPPWLKIAAGDRVRVLRDRDRLVVLG